MPVDRSGFRALCRTRSRESLVGFVAALEEARGRRVERFGEARLRVRGPAGARTVAVRTPADSTDLEADEVVVLGTVGEPDVRDLDDLHRELCYALDRPDARRLVADHFDRDPETLPDPQPGGPAGDTDGGWLPGLGRLDELPGSAGTLALALVAVLALAAVAAGAAGLPGLGGVDPATEGVEPVGVDGDRLTPVPDERASPAVYPDGLSRDGTVEPRVVSRVHRVYLDDRSYTARLSYREYDNGSLAGRYTEVIRVVNDSYYASRVATEGNLTVSPMRVAAADTYADGSTQYVRANGDRWSFAVRDGDPFLPTVRNYLAWKLSMNATAVERTPAGFRVSFAGEAYGTQVPVTGSALVSEQGLVRSLRRSYERNGTRVVVVFNTTAVGETTVEAPEWVA